ncbi:MAG: hypothetical protein LAT84_12380 [Balneolia bacterium]|nr:hypothetical protein [Balneolia bacterium]
MKTYEPETYWNISIRPAQTNVFEVRAERFAFLNVWRTYLISSIRTCAYVLVPNQFSAVVCITGEDIQSEKLVTFISDKLRKKLSGIFSSEQIEAIALSVTAERLYTEKDCIYKTFDLHTTPQKYGFSTDYRNYPFSSYKALANGSPSQIDQKTVWSWFGGKLRFSVFHQAYYGWVKPENMATAS